MRYNHHFNGEQTVLEAIRHQKHAAEAPCNGNGSCGKCLIKVISGAETPLTGEESSLLSAEQKREGYRLACRFKPQGVLIFDWEGAGAGFGSDSNLKENQHQHEHAFLIEESVVYPVSEQRRALSESSKRCGVSVDIGTTTVVASLLDLSSGSVLKTVSRLNAQKSYGLDVLSRISHQMKNLEKLAELHEQIILTLDDMLAQLLGEMGIQSSQLLEITIAANTAMIHFLLNLPADGLGKSPYASLVNGSRQISSADLGLKLLDSVNCYILPPVSAYIGGDISSGILHVADRVKGARSLFIDIGTNGELVLFDRVDGVDRGGEADWGNEADRGGKALSGNMVACSCAAGPAFEGMNLSMGMRAESGAVEDFSIGLNGEVRMKTIGNTAVRGLCGSGVFDLMSELIRCKLLGKTGRIVAPEDAEAHVSQWITEKEGKRILRFAAPSGTIEVTQQDIRQIQLAKAAIRSGIEALLTHFSIDFEDLDEVIIAGQFGKHIKKDSLIGIGIVPACLKDKLVYIGNASKAGATQCLMDSGQKVVVEALAEKVTYLELATLEGYERLFVSCLNV